MIKFDTREIELLARRLNNGAALRPSDRVQLLKNLGAEIEDQTRERFATKESPDSEPWADLKPSTIENYTKRKFSGNTLLFLSGQLHNTIESQVQNQWSVLAGATEEYAAVHQWGWEARGIDARPYLGVGPNDEQALAGIVTTFIQGLMARPA